MFTRASMGLGTPAHPWPVICDEGVTAGIIPRTKWKQSLWIRNEKYEEPVVIEICCGIVYPEGILRRRLQESNEEKSI
jgi:hypothetical protein